MNFGYQEMHEIDTNMTLIAGQPCCKRTVRIFIKPKGHNPIKWIIAPLVCTDIYLDADGKEKYREFNLSYISWGMVAAGFIVFGIAFVIAFLSRCIPPA